MFILTNCPHYVSVVELSSLGS